MTYILGLNAYHGDSSACLIRDGRLVAAAEEERFRRIKHWAGFPAEAIRYCLQEAGINLEQVAHVAINSDPKANLWKKIRFTLTKHPDPRLVLDRIKNTKERASVESALEGAFLGQRFQGKVHPVEHHLAHLASAFSVSPFKEAVAVSVDGFGDFASAAWGVGQGSHIEVKDRVYFPHSLGIFYQAMTRYLGFPHYGDEYKVMGLAPLGSLASWGPQFGESELRDTLNVHREALEKERCSVEELHEEGALCRKTARAIAEGKVVGWFQGRMEWGPRALGNRSIVCDLRRADMKAILNVKIKRRESFRPFAPSILREAVAEWFETDDEVPFMMQVFPICEEKRHLIPAVTHVDGSGRLQTVYRETNPRYYCLIEAFAEITGVPLVLNTSFNENEPVVCRPEEALDCFLRTQMDVLVLGNWMVQR